MDNRTWAMLCHLTGLIGYFANGLGSIIGPLIVWLVKKDTMPEVDYHGKEALNFNISIFIYAVLLIIPSVLTIVGWFIFYPILILLHLVFTIIAAIKAGQGEVYRYPMTIRLIK